MSAPIFLNTDEYLDILLDELPAGVFANDRADDPDVAKRSVSSSELRAMSEQFAAVSSNLESIYTDKFLSTVTASGLPSWERDFLIGAQDANQTVEQRRAVLVSKIRATGGISYPAIYSLIAGILGDTPFDLLPYSGQGSVGAWILNVTPIGYGSFVSLIDPIIGARTENGLAPLDCSFDYVDEGLTLSQLVNIQTTAYTFEVRLYADASADTLALLDSQLTTFEPARSTHVIRNNQVEGPADLTAYIQATPEYQRLRL